jgi:ubiquinol-cytochrome c reductase iron-sulfur subunit
MTADTQIEPTGRDFLYVATSAVEAVGATVAMKSISRRLLKASSSRSSGAASRCSFATELRRRLRKRAPSSRKRCPDSQSDADRVKSGHEQRFVVIGICTHLGCIPLGHQGQYDGWFRPYHGSVYDTAGCVQRGPAPANLYLPPYAFLSDARIRIS